MPASLAESSPVRDLRHNAAGTSTRASADTTMTGRPRTSADPASSAYSLTSADESAKAVNGG